MAASGVWLLQGGSAGGIEHQPGLQLTGAIAAGQPSEDTIWIKDHHSLLGSDGSVA